MSDLIQKIKVNDWTVTELEGLSRNLTYVDDKMVSTDFDETVEMLSHGKLPDYESGTAAMARVMSANGIRIG